MIADGSDVRPGISFPADAADPSALFAELHKAGIDVV